MHIEFRGDREDQGEFTAFYFRWIRLVGVSHRRILESITWKAKRINENPPRLPQISPRNSYHAKNNHSSRVNLSLFNTSPDRFKVESANVHP